MNINQVRNLTWQEQKKQLMLFMKEYSLGFPRRALHLSSMSQFVINRLLAPMKPSTRNNSNKIVRLREEFLRRFSMKFGLSLSFQFIIRGRFQPIVPKDILQFLSSEIIENQFLSISHYGTAALLGNTRAIAEMCDRLSKKTMDIPRMIIWLKMKLLRLIEYGISRRCPDCLGMMAHFLDTGFGIVPVDRQRALKLAGESAEAGSIYGWFAQACLLDDNSNHLSNYDKYDDGIDINECDLGVRQFIPQRILLDEQIRWTLEEHGCESCLPQFYDGKDKCRVCDFEFDVFNHYSDDDDTSVSKPEQMRIAVEIYYKILSENPPSHPICVDVHRNLINIYKAREHLFNGSIEATDDEIHRLERQYKVSF